MSENISIAKLSRNGHALHCRRCLNGLPSSQIEIDSSRVALVFYCLGSLDLLGVLETKSSNEDLENWRDWIWERQAHGKYGTGFKPSTFMTAEGGDPVNEEYSDYDMPHLIMTYTALLSLSIMRDDFRRLDRPGLLKFLRNCQREDGSFSSVPRSADSDLRLVYCAFAISSMLNDWSGVDVERAVTFINSCRTYEGGYGQEPFAEAHGGTTYCALAALYLLKSDSSLVSASIRLTPTQRSQTIRWLVQNQDPRGGFWGRTGKDADACYCFWCGAALQILDAEHLVDTAALSSFLSNCQFKFGGISKAPGENPDPYHTYLSLAALGIYSPERLDATWKIAELDPLLNTKEETARWARDKIGGVSSREESSGFWGTPK